MGICEPCRISPSSAGRSSCFSPRWRFRIRILYGTQWTASVPLARILCVAAAVEIAYFLSKEVLIARGDVRVGNHLQAALQCARILGLFAAIPFGLVGACWGLLAAAVGGAIWSHRVLAARIGLTLRQVVDTPRRSHDHADQHRPGRIVAARRDRRTQLFRRLRYCRCLLALWLGSLRFLAAVGGISKMRSQRWTET
jgi:hypothetical protein